MTVSRRLAWFAATLSWDAVPEAIRAKVGDHLLDTLGVMCMGATTPQHAALLDALDAGSCDGAATVIGAGGCAPTRDAAAANAFAGRIQTFDDTLDAGPVHPGSSVIAAALAAAEAAGASGAGFLRAVLAGYEIAARVALGLGPSHYARGFHATGTCNTFGAAAAAACARGLDADGITHALGMA